MMRSALEEAPRDGAGDAGTEPAAPPHADRIAAAVPFSRKVAVTAGCLAGLLALPYAHPSLARLRLLEPRAAALPGAGAPPLEMAPQVVGEAALPGETVDHAARDDEAARDVEGARGPTSRAAGATLTSCPAS